MLLNTVDETFEDILNYDDIMGKVEDIPTAVVRKSDGNTIKDFIRLNLEKGKKIKFVMKFISVTKTFNLSLKPIISQEYFIT